MKFISLYLIDQLVT